MAESASKKSNDRDADLHKPYVPLQDRIFKYISVEGFENCSLKKYALKLALIKHFASCGKIVAVSLINSVAFIRFEGEGAQEKALQLDGIDLGGWTAIVKAAVGRPLQSSFSSEETIKPSRVFVLGYDTGHAEIDIKIALRNHFSSCGEVTDVAFIPDGSAVITIEGEGCVEKALELNGRQMGGMNLVVDARRRLTEIPKNRRLIDVNSRGYVLGTYSREIAKRRKKMEKEKEKEKKKMEKKKMEKKKMVMVN